MSETFFTVLVRERRELQKVGSCIPTTQDIADVADYVKKNFGAGILDDIRPLVVKGDAEWAMVLLGHIISTNGQVPQFSREDWLGLGSGLPQHLVGLPLAYLLHTVFGRMRNTVVGSRSRVSTNWSRRSPPWLSRWTSRSCPSRRRRSTRWLTPTMVW